MKRLILVSFFVAIGSSAAQAEPVWIQVRESMLRTQPRFYASAIGSVRYGDRLEKISEEKGWVQVQGKGGTGYLPLSTVSRDHIVLSSTDLKKVTADSPEVVLAGKGFSKEVEQQYKKDDASLRYDRVDDVERNARVSSVEVRQFIKDGGLKD